MQLNGEPERARRARPQLRRKVTWPIWVALAAAALGIAAVALGVKTFTGVPDSPPVQSESLLAETTSAPASQTVEVPDVLGATAPDARLVLEAAGFQVRVVTQGATRTVAPPVVAQDPAPGTLATEDSLVTIAVPKRLSAAKKADRSNPAWIVCIDPGHQATADSSPEPIGPGSKTVKPAVTGGTTGVVTGIPEYEIALQIAMNLRQRLRDRGVKVIMTRTTNDVSLTNAERARIANRNDADLFVRVHGDGSPDSALSGVSTLYPGMTKWTELTTRPSKRAAERVQASVIAATGAVDRGIVARTDISGFNYATMPSILVETGFMSNPVEDRLLASPHYQDKIAIGLADGILNYLREAKK